MFQDINTRTFKPMIVGDNAGKGLKTLFQIDCVFVKNFEAIDNFDEEKLKKLILIMFYCYKSTQKLVRIRYLGTHLNLIFNFF